MTTIAKNQGQKSQNGICTEVIFELADSMTWAQTDTYASIFLPLGKCPKYMIKKVFIRDRKENGKRISLTSRLHSYFR